MTQEEKQKLFEELQFKEKWAKHLKLSPVLSKISKNVGKASKCNIKGPKKETQVVVDSKKKKK